MSSGHPCLTDMVASLEQGSLYVPCLASSITLGEYEVIATRCGDFISM